MYYRTADFFGRLRYIAALVFGFSIGFFLISVFTAVTLVPLKLSLYMFLGSIPIFALCLFAEVQTLIKIDILRELERISNNTRSESSERS